MKLKEKERNLGSARMAPELFLGESTMIRPKRLVMALVAAAAAFFELCFTARTKQKY